MAMFSDQTTSPKHNDKLNKKGKLDNGANESFDDDISSETQDVNKNEVTIPESWFGLDVSGILEDDPIKLDPSENSEINTSHQTERLDNKKDEGHKMKAGNKRNATSPLQTDASTRKRTCQTTSADKNVTMNYSVKKSSVNFLTNKSKQHKGDTTDGTKKANQKMNVIVNTPLALCRLLSMSQTNENPAQFLTKVD